VTSPPTQGGPARWIAPAAIVVLIAGLAAAYVLSRPPREAPPPAAQAPLPDVDLNPGERVIQEALAAARTPADSAAIKERWVDDVSDVDLAALDPPRREVFIRFANAERCTCGCGFTLAGCRAYDSSCETSLPLVRALFDSVRAGRISSAAGIRRRPR
jgi:hypothetical protein